MKKLTIAGASLGLALLTAAATAGYVQPAPVTVDLLNRTARGDQATARYSADNLQFIGCGDYRMTVIGGVTDYAFCRARSASGTQIFCSTSAPELVGLIAGSGNYGYVSFNWDADYNCTRVAISTQSFYLPKNLNTNATGFGGAGPETTGVP